jgi:hypothetical protein
VARKSVSKASRSRRAALGGATAHPIDFGRLSGSDFERLVFAYACRRWSWQRLEWYGQLGDDGGRDIIGEREDDWGNAELVVIACANWRRLTARKVAADLAKIVDAGPLPARVVFAAGGKVSSDLRDKASAQATSAGISNVEVWSGQELEENLRAYAASVLERFFEGEPLPEEASELRTFAAESLADEQEGLRIVARIFDRPAFMARMRQESSLPAFRVALGNTVEALNTGLWRTRDGALIARIPSKNDFKDARIREALAAAVRKVVEMRARFDEFVRDGNIRPCGCGNPDCQNFDLSSTAIEGLTEVRRALFQGLGRSLPELFNELRFAAPV